MSKTLKIVLIVVGATILIVAGAGVAGWTWFAKNKARLAALGTQATTEGTAFAHGSTPAQCIAEAIRRGDRCDGFVCEAGAKIFLRACAKAATTKGKECAGVPPRSEIMQSALWALGRCRESPHPDEQRCTRIIGSLQEHCQELAAGKPGAR